MTTPTAGCNTPSGNWFEPHIELNSRTRAYIQNHVMICLAGAEVEEHWIRGAQDPPAGWEDRALVAPRADLALRINFLGVVTNSYIHPIRTLRSFRLAEHSLVPLSVDRISNSDGETLAFGFRDLPRASY